MNDEDEEEIEKGSLAKKKGFDRQIKSFLT